MTPLPHNKSLDASGGSVLLNMIGAAKFAWNRAARVNSDVMPPELERTDPFESIS